MQVPLFTLCSADSSVTSLLGTSPCRLYPFGTAPQLVTTPYAVYQTVYASPEQVIDGAPDIDAITTQVDCYADTGAGALAVASVIRSAIETSAHIVGFREWPQDKDTKRFRFTLDVDWYVSR